MLSLNGETDQKDSVLQVRVVLVAIGLEHGVNSWLENSTASRMLACSGDNLEDVVLVVA